ncbi:hypothetical protein N7524_003892 [Penicillium chrysogenum]|nr:hypothetical protein N7524_003892 [Penicillium chrysogenum]
MSLKGKCPLTQGPHGALVRKHKICDFIVEESDRLPHIGAYVEVYGCVSVSTRVEPSEPLLETRKALWPQPCAV